MSCKPLMLLLGVLYLSPVAAGCIDKVVEGDPAFMVLERCGEPERRELEERPRSDTVEVVSGSETSRQRPHHPLRLERWYYETSLNAATVIHLEDGGVVRAERLERGGE